MPRIRQRPLNFRAALILHGVHTPKPLLTLPKPPGASPTGVGTGSRLQELLNALEWPYFTMNGLTVPGPL